VNRVRAAIIEGVGRIVGKRARAARAMTVMTTAGE
jgi:hypothetical protein